MNTNTAPPSAISGTPLTKSSPQKPIGVSEKKQEKRPTSNDGTTRYANELAGTFDKRCPFPNLMSLILCSPRGVLLRIIRVYHLPSNHYLPVRPYYPRALFPLAHLSTMREMLQHQRTHRCASLSHPSALPQSPLISGRYTPQRRGETHRSWRATLLVSRPVRRSTQNSIRSPTASVLRFPLIMCSGRSRRSSRPGRAVDSSTPRGSPGVCCV